MQVSFASNPSVSLHAGLHRVPLARHGQRSPERRVDALLATGSTLIVVNAGSAKKDPQHTVMSVSLCGVW